MTELIDTQRRTRGCGVVFVTHDINPVLDVVDRVLYIVDGRWAVGAASEVMHSEQLSRLYGTPVDVLELGGRLVVVGGARLGPGRRPRSPPRARARRARGPRRARTGGAVIALSFYLNQPFAQHALFAGALVALSCGLIGPFVVTRQMAFAVHGTSELAFTGAAAGLLIADNAVAGALVGALVVATVIGVLSVRERERDSAIGVVLAFGLGIGVLLLGHDHGNATAATNILFGDIFGVSNDQLLGLVTIGLVVTVAMLVLFRPLLFASVDPRVAGARWLRVRTLGIVFLLVLVFAVTEAAQIVGTLLVLSLAITPAAAAQRWSARPLTVTALSIAFALVACVGGILAGLASSTVKPSVFVTSFSFALYAISRLVAMVRARLSPASV